MRIFGPNGNVVTGEKKRQNNEELNYLYYSPNIIRVMKSRGMRLAGHVARIGRGEAHAWFWWGNLRERGHSGNLDLNGRIILKWIFRKWDVGVGTGLI